MTLKDFIREPALAKIGSIMRRCFGDDTARRINQHTYDIFGRDFTGWERREMPDMKKVCTIHRYKQMYPECHVFVETGTYFGATSEAVADIFKKVFTIEIDEWLFNHAANRLRENHNIFCIKGDSSRILPTLLCIINEPVIYWLDAHCSGGVTSKGENDTPIERELAIIFKHRYAGKSVILIDDAREFGAGDYPSLGRIRNISSGMFAMTVVDDIIRLVPKG